jgi:hypothetical protein
VRQGILYSGPILVLDGKANHSHLQPKAQTFEGMPDPRRLQPFRYRHQIPYLELPKLSCRPHKSQKGRWKGPEIKILLSRSMIIHFLAAFRGRQHGTAAEKARQTSQQAETF